MIESKRELRISREDLMEMDLVAIQLKLLEAGFDLGREIDKNWDNMSDFMVYSQE